MSDTLASPAITNAGEAPSTFGFSNALVVEVTGEVVGGLIGSPGAHRTARPVRGRFGLRLAPVYELALTCGTVALKATAPGYERDALPWTAKPTTPDPITLWDDTAGFLEDEEPAPTPGRVITEWSRKSRARMVRAMAEIDHDSWISTDPLAMVTLTLPGDWRAVAPTGQHFKDQLRLFRWRWEAQIGPWQAAWKLEFQERGAPHAHLMMRPPFSVRGEDFKAWLSRTWAECVGATGDEYHRHVGAGTNVNYDWRASDPYRVAVYFLKHSSKAGDSKEYQHRVPEEYREAGVGRFWGIAGLKRPRSTVELDAKTFYRMRRIMRHVHRANKARIALSRRAAILDRMSGDTWRRPLLDDLASLGGGRDRLLNSARGGGWILVHDAPALAARMAHWLAPGGGGALGPQVSGP